MSDAEKITKYIFKNAVKSVDKSARELIRKGSTCFAESDGFPLYGEYVDSKDVLIEFYIGEKKTDFEYRKNTFKLWLEDEHPDSYDDYINDWLTDEDIAGLIGEHLGEIFEDYDEYFDDVPELIGDYFFGDMIRTLRRR